MFASLLPTRKKSKDSSLSPKAEANRLGRNAILTALGSGAAYWLLGAIPLIGPLIAIGGIGFTAYQTWLWFQHRAKWGMRF
jgi:uncharacterized membrane protein YebE (DUF533 family)